LKIIREDCTPDAGQDKTLPNNSYLVEYIVDNVPHWDVVAASKKVEIFDYYYDKYRHDFVTMNQTEGRINAKLWQDPTKKKGK